MADVGSVGSNVMSLIEAAKSTKKATAEDKNNFSGDDFMTLLLTQMKYQNTLEQKDESHMMSQMAQLNMVGELEKLNTAMGELQHTNQITSGVNLVGKTVSYLDSTGEYAEMVVKETAVVGSKLYLISGDISLLLSDILSIKEGTL